MSKEMFISSSPHETKLAVLEDEQLVEVYFERDTDVGLVGGIYKGRVSRVLPGMQSAFVDIGLDRDAFLYVSDFFFEDQEDYDKILDEAEECAVAFGAEAGQASASAPPAESVSREAGAQPEVPTASPLESGGEPAAVPLAGQPAQESAPETAVAPPPTHASAPPPAGPAEAHGQSPFEPRGRRWRHRGRRFGEHRHAEHRPVPRQESPTPTAFEILPGESLAKYSHAVPESQSSAAPENAPAEPEASASEWAEQAKSRDAAELAAEATPAAAAGADVAPGSSPESTPREGGAAAAEAGDEVAPGGSPAGAEPASPLLPAPPAAQAEDQTLEFAAAPAEEAEGAAAELAWADEEPVAIAASLLPEVPGATAEADAEADEEPEENLAASPTESLAEGAAEPGAPLPEPEARPAAPEVPAASPGAPSEGSYTLREPHQRPRFAPRRGRKGRRGTNSAGQGEARRGSRPGNNQPVQISQLLKEGQEILVQISKEPLGGKGARITSHIALPGRYLVYMPTIDHIGVSRKISSEEERLRLRNIVLEHKGALPGGFIVRTAGQGRDEEELEADIRFLSTLWAEIRSKTEAAKAPALIHRDLDLVQRVLRDTLTPDFKSVRVDSEVEFERVLGFVNRSQPSLIGKVKLYSRETPLFEEFGIQAEIEKALKPKVWLKSGGYIVINQTEALVAIDVNTGKYVGKTNRLEDTILKTNFDAVNEIVRQIRLRDLGGIIVIDFIDMDERQNRAKVTQALEEALRKDRAPTKVIAFHDFGLVAITRKRVKQSLERTLCERCSYCSGSGWVKSATTVAYEVLGEARKMARPIEGKIMTLRVSPEVARVLKSRDGVLVSELESSTHKDVFIKSDPSVEQERFEIF